MKVFAQLEQGTAEWLELRRGILTASTIGKLVTPSRLQVAKAPEFRAELIAERYSGLMPLNIQNKAMERGHKDEALARAMYEADYALPEENVWQVGFITETYPTEHGLATVGYSPDGLVGNDGLIEIKSKTPSRHRQAVIAGKIPAEHMAQIQFGLMVTGRAWCDYVQFCGGQPLWVKRAEPSEKWQTALMAAVVDFERDAREQQAAYVRNTTGAPVAPLPDYYADYYQIASPEAPQGWDNN